MGYTFDLKYAKDETQRIVVEFVQGHLSIHKTKNIQVKFKGSAVKIGTKFIKRDQTDLSIYESC